MAEEQLKVYLDHHIKRDNLLYKRAQNLGNQDANQTPDNSPLRIKDLIGDDSIEDFLRKPDFQRATWAWTPEDCVLLLESMIQEQVIPGVIMWKNAENEFYVLDGAHRISVVLAWIKDDWGDIGSPDFYRDKEVEEEAKKAGSEVRKLMAAKKILPFKDYRAAFRQYQVLKKESGNEDPALDDVTLERARIYRVIIGELSIPRQWVKGGYDKAEASFLVINRSGRRLSEWETSLVKNRNSSFIRTTMSIANVTSAEYCWPSSNSGFVSAAYRDKTKEIVELAKKINKVLFEPAFDSTFERFQQPILVPSKTEPESKPKYVSELLTIIKGGKGTDKEIDDLIGFDKSDPAEAIVNNGLTTLRNAMDFFKHLVGSSSQSQSLSIVPALYLYTPSGKPVRGLLYGLIYWLFSEGEPTVTLARKRLFSAHRKSFERILIERRKDFASVYSRNVGSGTETTAQTARYYNKLLRLLIQFNDEIESDQFKQAYKEEFNFKSEPADPTKGRTATETQRAAINISTWLERLPRCEICEGYLDLQGGKQYDHIIEHSKGGVTSETNMRPTHPFCNNNRDVIMNLRNKTQIISLPAFTEYELQPAFKQLRFVFDNYEPQDVDSLGTE